MEIQPSCLPIRTGKWWQVALRRTVGLNRPNESLRKPAKQMATPAMITNGQNSQLGGMNEAFHGVLFPSLCENRRRSTGFVAGGHFLFFLSCQSIQNRY